jgi:hypothetical protein
MVSLSKPKAAKKDCYSETAQESTGGRRNRSGAAQERLRSCFGASHVIFRVTSLRVSRHFGAIPTLLERKFTTFTKFKIVRLELKQNSQNSRKTKLTIHAWTAQPRTPRDRSARLLPGLTSTVASLAQPPGREGGALTLMLPQPRGLLAGGRGPRARVFFLGKSGERFFFPLEIPG